MDAGGVVVEILETRFGRPGDAPTKGDLDTWINNFKLPVTTLMDPPGTGTKTYSTWGIREQVWVVDCRTMKILKHVAGSIAGIGDSAVKQALPFLMALLAK